jgi:hypothetical protein
MLYEIILVNHYNAMMDHDVPLSISSTHRTEMSNILFITRYCNV